MTSNPSGGPLSEPALAIRLLDTFGDLWFCDPDEYPVARQDEASIAIERFDEVRADATAWGAIAASLGIDATAATYPPEVKLAAYRLWKRISAMDLRPTGGGLAFDLRFAPVDGGMTGEHVVGVIAADGTISVESRGPADPPMCPICLARDTPILTPSGVLPADAVRVGDTVWTLTRDGERVTATVLAVASVPVPATHRMVRLALDDGRIVRASPGHPLPDGRRLGTIRPGDIVDGARVESADLVPYHGGRTYDLLVSGPTGWYLAGDGIPLASTLRP
jgi:hypothetical protein